MSHERIDIFAGYGDYDGRYEDMAHPHPILDHQQDENDDFWDSDTYFNEICNEQDFQAMDRVRSHLEEIQEEKYREFDRIHDAPLRHHKKVSST